VSALRACHKQFLGSTSKVQQTRRSTIPLESMKQRSYGPSYPYQDNQTQTICKSGFFYLVIEIPLTFPYVSCGVFGEKGNAINFFFDKLMQ
jgi:hypothetical protein